MNIERTDLFTSVLKRKFGRATCFLCGCRLGSKNRSDEHVIPKWVQKKYKLTDQRLNLLNDTSIPYHKLTIPCCFTCNNRYLQPLEGRISRAVNEGVSAVRSLNYHDIFLWLGKIFYGLLYRELLLPCDRTGKIKGTITNKQLLKRYEMHHLFLQSVRVPIHFKNFSPASILIVNMQEPDDIMLGWDFRDNLPMMCIACRMGSVGLVAVLQDGGAQLSLFPRLKVQRRKLHPLQFTEVIATVMYKATLFNRTPKYIIVGDETKTVVQMPLGGLSNKPLFDEWDQTHYAQALSQITGIPMEELFYPPDKVMSWLRTTDGKAKKLTLKKLPIQFGS